MGALAISSMYLLKPNSRTVKDLEFLFWDQTKIGCCGWRCSRIKEKRKECGLRAGPDAHQGTQAFFTSPVPSSAVRVLGGGGGGGGDAPCAFLEYSVHS